MGSTRIRTVRAPWAAVAAMAAVVLVAASCELAPPQGEGPLRFRDEVFTAVEVTAAVPYGAAVTQTGEPITLRYDLYEPADDPLEARPLLIWIHGGSFRSGSRTSPEIVDQANVFGRKGYVSASISYRLSERGCTVIDAACVQSITDAIEDAQAAVRHFRANADDLGIDPDRIAVLGTSAGAITALNVGYRTPVPGNSGTPGVDASVRSAVSLSGGVLFTGSIGPGDAKALLFHGTADSITPYSWAQDTHDTALANGLSSYLVTWDGAGHVPYVQHRQQIIDTTTNFLFHTLAVRLLL